MTGIKGRDRLKADEYYDPADFFFYQNTSSESYRAEQQAGPALRQGSDTDAAGSLTSHFHMC